MKTETKTDTEAPAETSMMRIVHQALRRDLRRAEMTLAEDPPPAQHEAIARHLAWMMSFLHAHHRSEDDGLYPLVRTRDPAASALLDAMAADHRAVASAIAEVEAAAAAAAAGATDRRLNASVTHLSMVLLPHLEREENEVMPIVSSVITDSEWRRLENEYNLHGKSFSQLGFEGHWLIDDASAADRERVVGLVPAIPRFILVHAFARSYRRTAAACWDPSGSPSHSVQMSGRCEVAVDADPDAIWDVVSDVTRVGEWSHECVGAVWLDGATGATPGARFRGRNRQGIFRWGRVCEIVTAKPYVLTWRTVPTVLYPDSTEWRIRLERAGNTTRVEQSFRVVRGPKLLALVYGLLLPAHRDRTASLTDDLRRLGDLAVCSV